jgi:hypothetical protein
VIYTWNSRDGSKVGVKSSGFIAQQVKLVEDEFGLSDYTSIVNSQDPNRYEITKANLIPIMVKAIQDLSKEQKELEEILKGLENK